MLRTTISNLKIFTGNILIVSIITSVLYTLITFEAPTAHAASKTLSDISTMQEMTQTICAKSKVGDTNTLTDTRDNNTYTIRKHEDNNCWMTENLRLVGEKTLTPADSDVVSDYILPASDINGFSASNYYASQVYYAGDETNGAYYSWTAATAGTGDASLTEGNAPSSVCPKGWKLPPNYGNGSYVDFTSAAGITDDANGSTKINSAPYSFPYTGFVGNSALHDVGSSSGYWSRAANSAQGVYHLWFTKSYINSAKTGNSFYGISLRCVALGGIATDSNLSVEVYPALMIDAVSNMHQIVDSSVVNTGTISTTITANTNYQVLLSSNDSTMRNPKLDSIDDRTIPTVDNTTPTILTPGTSAWGIATGSPDGSNGNSNSTYVGITTTPQSYYNTTSLGAYPSQTIHTYGIGVTISPLLPSGIYSTSITVTAVGV